MEERGEGMSYLLLFLSFFQVGVFSVGGGYAAIPLIQNKMVGELAWLNMKEFTDLITIAGMAPGSIGVNSAIFVGIRIAGFPGALAALFGCILPSCLIVSILGFVYYRYKNISVLQSILSSLRPAVVALIAAAGLSILKIAVFGEKAVEFENVSWSAPVLFVAALFLLRRKKWNPILVMGLCGAVGFMLHLFLLKV